MVGMRPGDEPEPIESSDLNQWQVEAIKQGMADADAGLVVPHKDVRAWAESLGTDREMPLPRAKRP